MDSISPDVAKKFCELCNWVYECWVTHKKLFDENDNPTETIGKAQYFTSRLSHITQEYVLLQICKLHDPAIQRNSLNLTIDYVIRFGNWGQDAENVRAIVSRLTVLFENIKSTRHKLLAHNDLETLMTDGTMGEFQQGLDKDYFQSLQELVNVVSEKFMNEPYPFNDLAEADVEEFLYTLQEKK